MLNYILLHLHKHVFENNQPLSQCACGLHDRGIAVLQCSKMKLGPQTLGPVFQFLSDHLFQVEGLIDC